MLDPNHLVSVEVRVVVTQLPQAADILPAPAFSHQIAREAMIGTRNGFVCGLDLSFQALFH